MTVNEIFNTACLICLRNEEEFLEQGNALKEKKLLIVNLALREFSLPAVSDINEAVNANEKKLDAVCYMAARGIASYFHDTTKLMELTEIFGAKRAAALCQVKTKADVLPSVCGG